MSAIVKTATQGNIVKRIGTIVGQIPVITMELALTKLQTSIVLALPDLEVI